MRIKIRNLSVDVKKCNGFGRFRGLMFIQRKKAKALLFDFDRQCRTGIHSLFVFFPFIAVWMDSKGKILETRKIRPFLPFVSIKKPYSQLVEIPDNKKYRSIVKLFL